MSNSSRRRFILTTGLVMGAGLSAPLFSKERTDSLTLRVYSEPSKDIPILGEYDIVVCGGGPTGCAAAISSARQGLKVLLLESQGQLGGTGVSGLVSHWLGCRNMKGDWIVGGVLKELAEDGAKRGFALIPQVPQGKTYQPHGWYMGLISGIPFDPYGMAHLYDEKMLGAGVDVLFFTHFTDVVIKNGLITNVLFHNKSGFGSVATKAVIDSTGDGDVAYRSNCSMEKGRIEDGLMTPTTLQFHVYNVDQDVLEDYITKNDTPRFKELISDLRGRGIWKFPYEIFISVQLHEKGVMMINTSRLVGFDGTDAKSVTQLMMEGRKETYELFSIMQQYFPGFKNARIKSVASLPGIRETRRITGGFRLTVDDLIKEKAFEDVIGYSSYGWDLPDPKKPSYQEMHENKIKAPDRTPILYRIMLPDKISNLICAGRMINVERQVLGPLRVMGPCMAMGQAAGIASVQVIKNSIAYKNIDIQQLKNELIKNGAII